MTRDGVDEPSLGCSGLIPPTLDAYLRADGWWPIEEAPLSGSGWDNGKWVISEKEVELEGLSACGMIVTARYYATGDYVDRWRTIGGLILHLTHWRVPQHLLG